MTYKELPDPELLRKLLRYEPDTGKLFWRERTPDMFGRAQDCSTWNKKYAGREALTASDSWGYLNGPVMGRHFMAHRIIWTMHYGHPPLYQIDHINGHPSDNRIKNLRDVPQSLNNRNCRINTRNTSGYNGVTFRNDNSKWQASIKINGKRKYLGYFVNIEDAIEARRLAEVGHGFTERHGT